MRQRMLGIKTIGNATLIAYDDVPILATDPWFGDEDSAFFGSWWLQTLRDMLGFISFIVES
jgi:hypothetical protein